MDNPEATVIAVRAQRVTVSVDAVAACPRCAAGTGCGAGLLGRRASSELQVKVAPGVSLAPGDRVRLEFLPAPMLRAAWLAYGLPLVGLVTGAVGAASTAPDGDLIAVAGSLAGLAGGAWLGRRALSRHGRLGDCVPTAAGKVRSPRP